MSVHVRQNTHKCQPIKARVHREITGKVKSITLSKTATGKYFASILVDDGLAKPNPLTDLNAPQVVGIDMGITDLAITSTGHKTGNPRFLKNAQRSTSGLHPRKPVPAVV